MKRTLQRILNQRVLIVSVLSTAFLFAFLFAQVLAAYAERGSGRDSCKTSQCEVKS